MTETVTSPAGDVIEVIPDAEYLDKIGNQRGALGYWDSKAPILEALWTHGPYVDESGFATRELFEAAAARGYSGDIRVMASGLRMQPSMDYAIDRVVNGKRTYRIALARLPKCWLDRLSANGPKPVEEQAEQVVSESMAEAIIEAATDVAEAVAAEERAGLSAVQLDVAQAVATALLAQVVDIVSTGKPDTGRLDALGAEVERLTRELESASARLAEALAYGQRTRRQLAEAGDELAAVKNERDGLRTRLRLAESNLAKAMSPANQRTLDELVHKEVDRVMRATPVHRAPGDEPEPFRPPEDRR